MVSFLLCQGFNVWQNVTLITTNVLEILDCEARTLWDTPIESLRQILGLFTFHVFFARGLYRKCHFTKPLK